MLIKLEEYYQGLFKNGSMAICKSLYWNLGIRIGIGTDITNAIISSSIRSMDPKLSKVVILDEGTSPTKSHDRSTSWSCNRSKTLYPHFHNAHGPQT